MYIFKAGIRAETLLGGGEEKSSEEIQVPWMSWKDLFEIKRRYHTTLPWVEFGGRRSR